MGIYTFAFIFIYLILHLHSLYILRCAPYIRLTISFYISYSMHVYIFFCALICDLYFISTVYNALHLYTSRAIYTSFTLRYKCISICIIHIYIICSFGVTQVYSDSHICLHVHYQMAHLFQFYYAYIYPIYYVQPTCKSHFQFMYLTCILNTSLGININMHTMQTYI